MKKMNIPLMLGSVILVLILLVMMFPEMFVDQSPYTIQHTRFIHEGGKLSIERAPYPPADDYFLGSDHLGRDIFSYIIYGTRLTITMGVLIAIGQFLVAIPIALFAGFGNRIAKSVIVQSSVIFSAIPALLIAIILLKLNFFTSLEKQKSIIAFVIVLTGVSWARLASLVLERVESILTMPFIKGEIAIGKRHFKIALENVMPHLAPELVILFFMEIARNLSLMMQLGIFAVFIGNLGLINDASSGVALNVDISFEPEWASMLSTSRTLISTAPWAVIFPALAFFISVLGFNLFGEGLRNAMQKKDSHAVLLFRKLITFDFRYIWKNSESKAKKKLAIWTVSVLVLLGFFTWINNEDYSIGYGSDSSQLPENVVIGTESAADTTKLIIAKMEHLGIEPMRDDDYLMSYDIGPSYLIESQMLRLNASDGPIEFVKDRDYAFLTSGNINETGLIYDATKEDLYHTDDYSRFEGQYILIDKRYYSEGAIDYFIKNITDHVKIKGILLVAGKDEALGNDIVHASEELAIVLISGDASEKLSEYKGSTITIATEVKPIGSTGYNVVGIHRGTDENIGDEAIIIGLNYNYLDGNGKDVLDFNLKFMERLCSLAGNKRSIIFLFLDGTINEEQHGIHYIAEDFPYSSQKVQVYIDLTGIESTKFEKVEFSTAQAPITRQFAWSLGHHLDGELIKKGFELKQLETMFIDGEYYFTGSNADNALFWNRGMPTIIVGTLKEEQNSKNLEELGSIILEVINKNNY
ncbi:MAG: ABC transporter permease [Bacillota bacterium]|nr:ABC transporter permease [Bacillota bacterium]